MSIHRLADLVEVKSKEKKNWRRKRERESEKKLRGWNRKQLVLLLPFIHSFILSSAAFTATGRENRNRQRKHLMHSGTRNQSNVIPVWSRYSTWKS